MSEVASTESSPQSEESNPVALVFLKPSYSKPEIIEQVEKSIGEKGLTTIGKGEFHFTENQATQFYSHREKPWFETLTGYITSAPVTYLIVRSTVQDPETSIYNEVREIAEEIRDKFGRKKEGAAKRKGANPIHASASFEEAKRELEILGIK